MTFKALSPVLLILIVSGLTSCTGDDGQTTESLNTQVDAPVQGGEGGPRYENPVPITSGDYWSSGIDFKEATDRATAAEQGQGSPFDGDIAGIRVVPLAKAKASDRPSSCDVVKFEQTIQFKFTYLPPGTSAATPQYAGICADSRIRFIEQDFVTKHGTLVVSFNVSDSVLFYDAPTERVHTITIKGAEALAIEPPIPEGLGSSLVGQLTQNGYLLAQGAEMPASELIAVMEGTTCANC